LASIVAGILVTIPKGGHHVFGFWKVGILGALFTLIAIWMMSKITKISTQKNDQL